MAHSCDIIQRLVICHSVSSSPIFRQFTFRIPAKPPFRAHESPTEACSLEDNASAPGAWLQLLFLFDRPPPGRLAMVEAAAAVDGAKCAEAASTLVLADRPYSYSDGT